MKTDMYEALPASWQAKWINPELPHDKDARQPASYLRRTFTAKKADEAHLFITCHGLYEVYINGERVGDFVLAPGTGDYKKRLTVQCYDVSSFIKAGEMKFS
jgi:alpha-L-rhamnosidase